ncbi:MAG: CPBP family intramembrane metalloprotease [candidate division WOR-3 bacterium]|nr:MAG: CPBP family intramembrane metalloprotease [candidate division WOR-3 bacterium]
MSTRERVLLIAAPALFPVTLGLFQFCSAVIGGLRGYILGLVIYWIICVSVSVYILYGNRAFFDLYRIRSKNLTATGMISVIVTFIPVIATFSVAFLKAYHLITTTIFIVLIIMSALNGFIEELLWRGTYFVVFAEKDTRIAYFMPTFYFALWHVSLFFYRGIRYTGGIAALVGGALIMGAIWAWGVSRQKSLLFCTIAHILTNFFAFSQFLVENWA